MVVVEHLEKLALCPLGQSCRGVAWERAILSCLVLECPSGGKGLERSAVFQLCQGRKPLEFHWASPGWLYLRRPWLMLHR